MICVEIDEPDPGEHSMSDTVPGERFPGYAQNEFIADVILFFFSSIWKCPRLF